MIPLLTRALAVLAVALGAVLAAHGAASADTHNGLIGVEDTAVVVPLNVFVPVQDVNLAVLGTLSDLGGDNYAVNTSEQDTTVDQGDYDYHPVQIGDDDPDRRDTAPDLALSEAPQRR